MGKKKQACTAAVASTFIWGSGQCLNRQYEKGILYLIAQVACLFLMPSLWGHVWGLITLGDTAMVIEGSKVTHGDNSILLMIKGLLFLFIAIFFVCIYITNIRDAYRQGKK